jgi:hypothetical protein
MARRTATRPVTGARQSQPGADGPYQRIRDGHDENHTP